MNKKEDPFYKKLSFRITREGSKYPLSNDYTYKFTTSQFLENIDDMSNFSSYSYNDIKEKVIDNLVEEFRASLNSVVFGDPSGREYVEQLSQEQKEKEYSSNGRFYDREHLQKEYKKLVDEYKCRVDLDIQHPTPKLTWWQKIVSAFKNRIN